MNDVLQWAMALVDKATTWVDSLFGYFGFYTERYSKLIVFGFLGLVLAKFFKGRIDLGLLVGKKK